MATRTQLTPDQDAAQAPLDRGERPDDRDERPLERLDRNEVELMGELRVAPTAAAIIVGTVTPCGVGTLWFGVPLAQIRCG